MSNFFTDVTCKDKRFHSPVLIKDMDLLEPVTRANVLAIIADAKAMGHDLRVGETFRSQARQHEVFINGASKLSKVGCHGYSVAADLQLFENGHYVGDGSKYQFLLALCRKHHMISGIDWGHVGKPNKQGDDGHVQRITIHRQDSLFAGTWYPDASYDPLKD